MRILDNTKLKIGLGYTNASDTPGIVFKLPEDTGVNDMLGVIIPKFMVGYDYKAGDKATDKTVSIKNSKCINASGTSSFFTGSVVLKNYINVRPLLNQNQCMPTYVIGDKVLIKVIDDDIKTLMFLPYSINKLGQRAVDTFRVAVPANPKINTELTEDNTYYLLLDSINQYLELSTSQNNKEACVQTLKFDGKNGIITITDNKDMMMSLDTKNDEAILKTSGSSIKATGDKTVVTADTIEINGDSNVKIKTDTLDIDAETINSSGSNVTCDYDNFKQTSDTGKYEISTEEHSGNAISFKGSTFHVDIPLIGLNGTVIFPTYTIGAVSNINVPVPPTSGMSGPNGTMCMQTDPTGLPLVKFPQLMSVLSVIAAAADMYPCGAGSASAAVSSLGSSMMTSKIMCS